MGQPSFSVLTHSTSSENPSTASDLMFLLQFLYPRDLHCDTTCPTLEQFQHLAFLCIISCLVTDYPVFGAVEAPLFFRIEVHASPDFFIFLISFSFPMDGV